MAKENVSSLKGYSPKRRSSIRGSSSQGPRHESLPLPGFSDEGVTALPSVGSSTDEAHRRRNRATRTALCAASLVGAMVLVLSLTLMLWEPRIARSAASPCLSPSCHRYMRSMEVSMDTDRDPCVDFYAFVCARWTSVAGGHSLLEDALLDYQNKLIEQAAASSPPPTNQSRFDKATLFYQSCISTKYQGTAAFRALLQNVSLPWPAVNTSSDPLNAVIALSIRWRLPMFLNALVSVTGDGGHKLTVLPAFLSLDLDTLLKEHQQEEENTRRICLLYHALKEKSQNESSFDSEEWCQQLAKFQADVLYRLSNHSERRWVSYGSVHEFSANATLNISGELWARHINNHARHGPHVVGSSDVEAYDPGYIKEFATILVEKPKEDLLSMLGLTFVEVLGRFVSELAPFIQGGRDAVARERHAILCYRMTDVALPGALGSSPALYLYHQHRIKKAKEVSGVVLASVGEKLRQSSWLSGESKHVIARSLLEAPIVIEGLERKAMAEKHKFPAMTNSFLLNVPLLPDGYWVNFHRRFHYSASNVDWTDPWRLANVHHGPLRLVVPDVYMLQRVFPDDAFESVNYATVGSLIARQATAALITGSITHSSGRKLTWLTPEERLIRQGKNECLIEAFEARYNSTQGTSPVDPSALYVAWASLSPLFTSLHFSAGFPEWSVGFHHYTPQQLLFIALCFTMCRQGVQETYESSEAAWCNFLLGMFRPFAKSFQCPEGLPMHPVSYCNEL